MHYVNRAKNVKKFVNILQIFLGKLPFSYYTIMGLFNFADMLCR